MAVPHIGRTFSVCFFFMQRSFFGAVTELRLCDGDSLQLSTYANRRIVAHPGYRYSSRDCSDVVEA